MKFWRVAMGLFVGFATLLAFLAPNAASFRSAMFARIMFVHVPSAMITSIALIGAAVIGVKYLRTRDLKLDASMAAAIEIAAMFSVITMLTGILFSKTQWGEWWQNDPRQLSFMMVMFFYLALMVARSAFPDPQKRASASAGYAVALLIPALFLIFVFPRLPQVKSFHPNDTLPKGQLDQWYGITLLLNFIALSWVTGVLYKLRVKVGVLELKGGIDEHGSDHSGDSESHCVVRPVALSQEPGSTHEES
ncbi:MAG: cytochrome c biogenesis protein CcsA [Armatimonadetes bacterium]|nr:cytochrome c biogenesis protein CcsA [Armatimonadota bacterium]